MFKFSKEEQKNFIKFIREEGDTKVPNPNPKSRERFPEVQITSLPNSEEGQSLLKRLFQNWLGKRPKKQDSDKKPSGNLKELPPLETSPPKVKPFFNITDKEVDEYLQKNKRVFAKYNKIVSKMSDEKVEEEYSKIHGELPEGSDFDISIEEKKVIVHGHHFGQMIAKNLKKKHKNKYNLLFGDGGGGWPNSSFDRQTAVLQAELSKMGVKGHVAGNRSDRELYEECKSTDSYEYQALDVTFSSESMRDVVKDMYVATQAFFKSQGIKEITMFRGVKKQLQGNPPNLGDTISLLSRELSSWSTDPYASSKFGRIVAAKVPVEQILGGFITDPIYGGKHVKKSLFDESELMVLETSGIESTVISK